MKNLKEGKKDIYVDPQYLPEEPPAYDYDEEIDYTVKDEDDTQKKIDTDVTDLTELGELGDEKY